MFDLILNLTLYPTFLVEVPLETWFVSLAVILVLTVFLYLVYSGILHTVVVSTSDTKYGPITFAYKTHTGHYRNVGEFFTESFCLVPDREQLGIYYDDPEGVPPDQLRAAVGPILAVGGEKADPGEMEKCVKEGFKITYLPKPSFVVTARFPFRTTLSIFIAIYKVYSKLRDYISQRNLCAYPAMEVYTDSEIIFLMPLSRQEEFFVSEFQEEEMSVATTDMTGSVMTVEVKSDRDKDGFLIPQSPRSDASSLIAGQSELEEGFENVTHSDAEGEGDGEGDGEMEEEGDGEGEMEEEGSLAIEASAQSRDS